MSESDEVETIGDRIRESLELLKPSEESFLPAVVVQMQRELALMNESELMHLIVGASAQLSARDLGTTSPGDVLRLATATAERMGAGGSWLEEVGPEVRRLSHLAREEAGLPPLFAEPELPPREPEPEAESESDPPAETPPPPPES